MVGSHGIESKERLAARGESLAAFDGRCIPAGYVAPPSNPPGILSRRALPSGRLARLGATPDFHHGLLSIFLCGFGGFCVVRDFFTLLGGLPRRRRRPRGRQPPRFLKSSDLSMGLALTIQRAGVSVRPACSSTGQSPPSASCSSS